MKNRYRVIFIPALVIAVMFLCSCTTGILYKVNSLDHTSNSKNDYSAIATDAEGHEFCQVADVSSWDGEYFLNSFHVESDTIPADALAEGAHVVDYAAYKADVDWWASTIGIDAGRWKSYSDTGCNFIVAGEGPTTLYSTFDIVDAVYENGEIVIYASRNGNASANSMVTTVAIPTDLPVGTPVKWRTCTISQSPEEDDNLVWNPGEMIGNTLPSNSQTDIKLPKL